MINFKEIEDNYKNKPSMFQIRLFAEKRVKPKITIRKRKFYKRKIGPIRLFFITWVLPIITKLVSASNGGGSGASGGTTAAAAGAGVVAGAGALAAAGGIAAFGYTQAPWLLSLMGPLAAIPVWGWIAIGIIAMFALSGGCGDGCGDGCGGGCGGCAGEPEDTESDGSDAIEDTIDNEAQQPEEPPSICEGMPHTTDISITGTKSAGATYNTYTYSYSIKACNGNVAYDIYLKGVKRLTCESGAVANERSKSGSNTVTHPGDFGSICIDSSIKGVICSALS